ncbi:MAG TPA: hypothetical protein PL124_05165 [Candidatus Cloacimonadota bacterium]|nr:hypothetical protein [Candidatus Cloacimonadota bacterium]HPS38786.1 hypothetical protein [Candidatus Cloacimonadota bacterium]
MENLKKQIAAISGVMAYLADEAEPCGYTERKAPQVSNPWSLYARQQTMQYRDITQRRIIKRSR